MTDYSSKRITVMGLGRFGGGIGVTRFLASQGADVLVTDLDPEAELADSVAKIQDLIDAGTVALRLGGHNVADFTTCDLVVANAAVPKPWDNRFIRAAEAAGIPITTEITLMLERVPSHVRARTIAITGSVGKSTTTAMIHHALSAAAANRNERVLLGGNIGGSLLEQAAEVDDRTWLILELSSAQLYWIDRVLGDKWNPHVALVTNIAENHTDWHGSFDHYSASKQNLLKHLTERDHAILGETVWAWRGLTKAAAQRIDPAAFTRPLKLPGDHNRVNAAAAFAAILAAAPEIDRGIIEKAIADFPGLAHRLQLVAETPLPAHRGAGGPPARFYNDSKSTTPDSALKAIEAVASAPGSSRRVIHLIAGGHDKGSDLTPIARAARELAGLYTIGVTGPKIAEAAMSQPGARDTVFHCETLDKAVARAITRMKPGDALLFSPGCASWDQYTNFEERGEEFIALVREVMHA